MRHAEPLGQATTDRDGKFEIGYTAKQFRRAEKERADLFIRVLDHNGRELYESETRFNAKDVEVFDIEIPLRALIDSDEWSWMCSRIAAPLENVPLAELNKEDLEFLSAETNLRLELLEFLRLDAAWSCAHELPHGIFYAMFRQGLPSILPTLLATSPERWREAVKSSIEAEIVPRGLEKQLDEMLACLEALADEIAVSAVDDEAEMPEVAVLRAVGVGDQQRSVVARALRRRDVIDEALFSELAESEAFDDASLGHVRFAIEAAPLVLSHLPTLKELQEVTEQRGWSSVRDLTKLPRVEVLKLAENAADLPTGVESAEQFGVAIADSLEKSFPGDVVRHALLADSAVSSAALRGFLTDNPDFDLASGRVDATDSAASVLPILKSISLATRLLSETSLPKKNGLYAGVKALVENGYTSARAVVDSGEATFVKATEHELGREAALESFATARKRSDAAELMLARLRDRIANPTPATPAPDFDDDLESPLVASVQPASRCACEHCRSVYGPASYLADLLVFLRGGSTRTAAGASSQPLEVLLSRRPDIDNIVLNCANANTPLPYIDLVNELLVDLVEEREPTARQTTLPAEELRVFPETEASLADALATIGDSVFPWMLPYDDGFEEQRALAEHLGFDRAALLELVGADRGEWARVALQFNRAEWQLLTRTTSSLDRWGEKSVDELRAVPVFLETTGLEYGELVALTNHELFDGISINASSDPCDFSGHTIEGLTEAHLEQIQRFVLVSRRLDLAIDERSTVARSLVAFSASAIDNSFLIALAELSQAGTRLRMSLSDVLDLTSAQLARRLRTTVVEVERFAMIAAVSQPTAPLSLARFLAEWEVLRDAQLAPRDLAYVLSEEDSVPSSLTPSDEDLATFIGELYRAIPVFVEQQMSSPQTQEEIASVRDNPPPGFDEDRFIAALRERFVDTAIVTGLSQWLGLDSAVVELLVSESERGSGTIVGPLVHATRDAGLASIRDFDFVRTYSVSDADIAEDAAFGGAAATLLRLHRSARLLSILRLDRVDLEALVASSVANGFPTLESLLTDGTSENDKWIALRPFLEAVELQRSLRFKSPRLFELLADAAARYASADLGAISTFEWLAEVSGWSASDIRESLNSLGLASSPNVMGLASTYAKLSQVFRLARAYLIEPSEVVAWSAVAGDNELAARLRAVAEAKAVDTAAWRSVATPISDRLREARRDAFLAHLLAADNSFSTTTDIYNHLLIDPEMSSCQLTSRIKQANAAVQLFVQRILLGLEDAAKVSSTTDEHWWQWEWMGRYRIWEANRKVFLYPENWIEPELRDGTSAFFDELADELLEQELSEASIDDAYRRYLTKLDSVARLDVRGLWDDEESGVLHVFGRTHSEPHLYYYRRRLKTGVWTPWEPLDLPIEGDHLIPVIHHGLLMLMWATFAQQDESWLVNLHWSYYRDGRWSSRRSAAAAHVLAVELAPEKKVDVAEETTPPGVVRVRSQPTDGVYTANDTVAVAATPKRFDADPRNFFFRVERVGSDEMLGLSLSLSAGLQDTSERLHHGLMQFVYDECVQAWRIDELALQLPLSRPPAFTYARSMGYRHVGGSWVGTAFSVPPRRSDGDDEFTRGGASNMLADAEISRDEYEIVRTRASASAALRPSTYHKVLGSSGAGYDMINAPRHRHFVLSHPFFVSLRPNIDSRELRRTNYLVRPKKVRRYEPRDVSASMHGFPRSTWKPTGGPQRVWFEMFYHPYTCEMVATVAKEGVLGLLAPLESSSLDRQARSEPREAPPTFASFSPISSVVLTPHPREEFDFSMGGAYSTYNWEVFFHIPLLIAERLRKAGRYAEAQKWFHYIFNPIDTSPSEPEQAWRVKPLFEQAQRPTSIDELLAGLAAGESELEDDIEEWRRDPFNPHRLARHRHIAYMRAVVLRYIENLIAWADSLFERDSIESLNEATQLYVLAADLLGEPVPTIDAPEQDSVDFSALRSRLDEFSNSLIELEELVTVSPATPTDRRVAPVPRSILYFCVPTNPRIKTLWERIGDRLFKIRHCQNIEGTRRQLPLFEPPIDPALLVRARAAGLDLRRVLDRASSLNLPNYRYPYLFARAVELCNEVRGLGSALLSALEKRDAEELSMLRSRHERALLDRVSTIKRRQVEEAEEQLETAKAARAQTEARRASYESRAFTSNTERAQQGHLDAAHLMSSIGEGFNLAGSVARLVPETTASASPGTTFGGANIGGALGFMGSYCGFIASQSTYLAQRAATLAGYERRQEEWDLQIEQAELELNQHERQILAAEIRLAIARSDENNHRAQLEQSREVELFFREKFTNRELYGWMSGQLSSLYREAFAVANAAARHAERAAQNELGLKPGDFSFVRFGQWEDERRGLLAGERLSQDLRAMDAAFHSKNKRENEITKHISLAALRPQALISLRQSGECGFVVPEIVYDLDFPGQYRRRIKSVSISIPSVTGPTTNVSAKLSLEKSWVREHTDFVDYQFSLDTDEFAVDSTPRRSLATSTGNRDAGLFELSFRDERTLPFEGAGAVSQWRLELPGAVPTFDYNTISDVILHISYTSVDGPPEFSTQVGEAVKSALDSWVSAVGSDESNFTFLISMRHQHSASFHQLLHPQAGSNHRAAITLGLQHLPFFVRTLAAQSGPSIGVESADVWLILEGAPNRDSWVSAAPSITLGTSTRDLAVGDEWGGQPHASFELPASTLLAREWTIEFDRTSLPAELIDSSGELETSRIKDVMIAFTIPQP